MKTLCLMFLPLFLVTSSSLGEEKKPERFIKKLDGWIVAGVAIAYDAPGGKSIGQIVRKASVSSFEAVRIEGVEWLRLYTELTPIRDIRVAGKFVKNEDLDEVWIKAECFTTKNPRYWSR